MAWSLLSGDLSLSLTYSFVWSFLMSVWVHVRLFYASRFSAVPLYFFCGSSCSALAAGDSSRRLLGSADAPPSMWGNVGLSFLPPDLTGAPSPGIGQFSSHWRTVSEAHSWAGPELVAAGASSFWARSAGGAMYTVWVCTHLQPLLCVTPHVCVQRDVSSF